jgi:hypothetical protein
VVPPPCLDGGLELPSKGVTEPTDKKPGNPDKAQEAAEIADELDRYLEQRIDPQASADEDAAAVIAAHEEDPRFRRAVRRLSKALGLGH